MTKETLIQNEQLFRALIEYSTDAITLITPDGTITYASPSTAQVTGYTPEEVVDANRIEQVLTNYLTNAFKFSPADQVVQVQLSVDGLMARVSVRDQGPGLTLEQQRVWERFYQVEPARHHGSDGGLGLGLYIVRTIIAQHQGQMGVESCPGQGSTFWFLLPLADEPISTSISK